MSYPCGTVNYMGVTQDMYCETCAAVTPFEPCSSDDHEDCTDWACTLCGEAIVLAPLTPAAAA